MTLDEWEQKNENMDQTPTKAQILEAAKTSPEARQALEKLFPQHFPKNDLVEISKTSLGYEPGLGQFHKTLANLGVESMVCLGMAPKDELNYKIIKLSNPALDKLDLVIMDKNGNIIGRHDFENIFIGVAPHKAS
jgi:hypothetical protein